MAERIYLYDTTLRDGGQTHGVDFTTADKVAIARMLDQLGVDYVEAGWPGANPTDDGFFADPPALRRAKLCAFGMTRRAGRSAANDPGLAALFESGADAITLVGKSSARQVEVALGVALDENLRMIEDSVGEACGRVGEVLFDAEHFFDGYAADPAYALACLEAARQGGARWIVLCDTNGGRLPHEVASTVEQVARRIPPDQLGIHAHNDTANAVANTLAALRAGARQAQGTLNGLGERCGNADLIALIPTLVLKLGYETGVSEAGLRHLTGLSRAVDERLNRIPDRHAAYVGACAFTHKAGLHASAVAKDPSTYEHVPPEAVGNTRHVAVSDQAGRANLLTRLNEIGLQVPAEEQLSYLLGAIKEREACGYAYEGAEASFELLARRTLGQVPDFFRLSSFRIIDERRHNARNELVTLSEATIKVDVGDGRRMIVAEGNGPVHALDTALRQALSPTYPALEHMHLADYKVRILTPEAGTAAVTRVIIESADDDGRRWSTVGVSTNVIDASYAALHDAITYKLFVDGAAAAQ
jgi:2-isopropylmalate synthase